MPNNFVSYVASIALSTIVVVLVLYALKWAFVDKVQVPVLTEALKNV